MPREPIYGGESEIPKIRRLTGKKKGRTVWRAGSLAERVKGSQRIALIFLLAIFLWKTASKKNGEDLVLTGEI